MKGLILAIQFLSRIPININIAAKENSFADSVIWFPAAGLLIGAFSGFVYWLTSLLLEGMFPIVCAVLANVCITGGLHVDGLADTCDGIFSARKRERMLEIMKDSRIGSNGALAIVFDIIARIAVLGSVNAAKVLWIIVAVPVASKAILPLIMKISIYARAEGGMGSLFMGKISLGRTLAAFVAGAIVIWLCLDLIGVAAFVIALLAALLLRSYIYSKIQGMTGDTIGASNEAAELVFILAVGVLWRYFL